MAIALVGHIQGVSTGVDTATALTGALDTSGSSLIVIAVAWYTVGSGTLTDSKSNTWTGLTIQTNAAFNASQLYYCMSPTVGSGHTFQFVQAGGFPCIFVSAWSGTATSSVFDVQNGATGTDVVATGSVTPSTANQLLVTGLGTFGTGAISIDTGFTITDSISYLASTHVGGGQAYLIETTATAKNPSWTTSTGGNTAVTIATFKAGSVNLTVSVNEPTPPMSNF